MSLVDLSDEHAPRLLGVYRTPAELKKVAVTDGHAYLAAGKAGLLIADLADLSQPAHLASASDPTS